MLKTALRIAATLLTILPLCASTTAHAAPGEYVMIAPLDQAMPIVRFENGILTGGILKDLGDAMAKRLGRRPVYISVDVPGVKQVLTSGRADGMCYVMPFWIDGDYNWSTPLLSDTEMVVARGDAPQVGSLRALRNKPVGTVAGYRYPRIEQVLGKGFTRVDALTIDQNIQARRSTRLSARSRCPTCSATIRRCICVRSWFLSISRRNARFRANRSCLLSKSIVS
jgi:ABC-type amino acid transport substrate-binding protein